MAKVIFTILAIIALGTLAFLLFFDRAPHIKPHVMVPKEFIVVPLPVLESYDPKSDSYSVHFIIQRSQPAVIALYLDMLKKGGWTIDSQSPSDKGGYTISGLKINANTREQAIIYIGQNTNNAESSISTDVTVSYSSKNL